MSWFDGLLWPIMWVVAWIMVQFHSLLSALGLDPAGGAAWALSIVGLVIVIRIALIPLFFRQIKASRGLQLIQPEMQAIQKKYKGKTDPASREAMSRETMELYRKHGTNPFSSCLPILAQSPIFFALFRVLNSLTALATGKYGTHDSIGPLTQELASQAEKATVFGAPLSGTFMQPGAGGATRAVAIVLIIAMSVTTFTTQRQLTMKNMPPAALEGPVAQQQKMLLYVMPLIFAFSGINFPIGVLIYWTTTNLWSMGQQFYTIRRMPAPGSQAEAALKARQARKAAGQPALVEDSSGAVIEERPRGGQRQQPVRKDRARKAGAGKETPAADTAAERSKGPEAGTGRADGRDVPAISEGLAPKDPRPRVGGVDSGSAGPRKPRRPARGGSPSADAARDGAKGGGPTRAPRDEPDGESEL
ncbi:MAG: membrane protein insertase YidC [Actinobacteria bacterium]|nr:membrane protein insertase YidC [Actinomycetota bacterium]MCG2801212.1 membrane protein insertase YidC [Cellulomonas sp.]